VRAAGGPGWALAYHGAYEFGTPLEDLPGGREWQAVVERTPPQERHLAVHDQHCVGLNEADRAAWEAGGDSMLGEVTMSGTPERVRERLAALGDQGVTEIVFQPCGTDIRRELEVFMDTAKTAVPA
jgi:5,10-methylenetetrahydromethanopterin reductase